MEQQRDVEHAVRTGARDVDAALVRRIAEDGAARTATSTASADSVESLRRLVRDLKHDVRMLKVVVDKQFALLERHAREHERS